MASKPLTQFLRENIKFIQASNYLLTVQLSIHEMEEDTALRKISREFSSAIRPTFPDPHNYFMAALFTAFVASFELYLQEIATEVVRRHPMKAGSIQFKLADLLEADSKDELISRAIEETLSRIMYKRPLEYRDELAKLLSIDASTFSHDWPHFVEAKARRDLGAHANWICNSTYLRKVQEAGLKPTMSLRQSAVPDWSNYSVELAKRLQALASVIDQAVLAKYSAQDRA